MSTDATNPSSASGRHDDASSHEARLARLEEMSMFNERLAEQLHAEVSEAFNAMERLTRRIDVLERRLGQMQHQLETDDPGPEKPPHSA